MNDSIERQLRRSSEDFINLVWPKISPALGRPGLDLLPVETVSANDFAEILDRTAGIDAWIVQRDRHVFGLASRVQWLSPGRAAYKTFTVRTRIPTGNRTEYDKRQEQIATTGSVYPVWTAQAYVECACPRLPVHDGRIHAESRRLLPAALAWTTDVIAAVTAGWGRERRNPDGTRFWCVPWQQLWTEGCLSLHVIDEQGALWSREAA